MIILMDCHGNGRSWLMAAAEISGLSSVYLPLASNLVRDTKLISAARLCHAHSSQSDEDEAERMKQHTYLSTMAPF